MKRNNSIVIILLLLTTALHAQQVIVQGTVLDADTQEPLPFASVQLTSSGKGTTTDPTGNFRLHLTAEEAQNASLTISFIGYTTLVQPLNLKQNRYSIRLRPDATTLPEITVVSGTLKEILKVNSTIPVDIYTPALFRKNPTPNIFESLVMVNGVQPQLNCSVCNTGDIHINGMEGPYTMILIDGIPIVSSLSTVYGLAGIPNSMVKRMEIIKGPASTLYGSEAVAGIINIITKEPSLSPRVNIDVQGTSVGEINTDLSSKWTAGKLTALLGVNYFLYNNPLDINRDNFTDVTQQNRISVFNKWLVNRKKNRQASLAVRYVYEDRWGGELQWNKSLRGSNQVYGESIYTNRAELIGHYQLPLPQKVYLDYSYNYHLQDSYYGISKYLAEQQVAFAQLRWDAKVGLHDLLVGVPFRFTYYNDNTPGTGSPRQTFLPGLFIQDEFEVARKITFLTGIRYDHHNVHGNIFSPRLAVKYTPAGYHTFRVSGGNGFRVVNLFTEDHAALSGSREVVIKNELNPEQSWNINFNYTTILRHASGYVNLDGSVFYTRFTNKIVGDFLTHPDQIIYDNLNGYAISKGVTLNIDVALTNGLKFIAGTTLMDVYQKQRDSLEGQQKIPQLFAPFFSGTWALSYAAVKSGLTLDFTGRVTGPMYLPVVPDDFRPEKSPWFGTLNIQLTKAFTCGIEVYGGIKNLLNFIPEDPVYNWQQPFSESFDTSYNYAPVQGIKAFLGIRYTLQ